MHKKKNEISTDNRQMTDSELSKRLGHYQTVESISILLGVLMVIAACILAFILRNVILLSALAFTGVILMLLVGKPAQDKKKALLWQQLGGYFRDELTKAFGPEPENALLPIDDRYLRDITLINTAWTECNIENFREGVYNGVRFSAANVELCRTVEEKSGPDNDNWMTRSETLFHGIVVRCADICDAAADIAVRDMFQERKKDDITVPEIFAKHFAVSTSDGGQALITPQLRKFVNKLEEYANKRRMASLIIRNGGLTLALNTNYVFAGIPNEINMRDIDGIRKWFALSIKGMERLLDILINSPF